MELLPFPCRITRLLWFDDLQKMIGTGTHILTMELVNFCEFTGYVRIAVLRGI